MILNINIIDIAYNYFERPYVLFIYLFIFIVLIYLINKNFVELSLENIKKSKSKRLFIFISRALVFLLLIIALAGPFIEKSKTIHGEPRIKILVDNSTSMQLYDLKIADKLKIALENKIPTEIEYITFGDKSAIADALMANVKKNENILLISDGNNNVGIELGDVVLRANALNATINAIKLKSKNYDTSISIAGSDKTIADVENTFKVRIQQTEKKPLRVIVDVDGQQIINKITDKDFDFKQTFISGYHKITAKIDNVDYFPENSVYYKTIKVVPKPKILIIGKETDEIETLFKPIYDVVIMDNIPENLKDYTSLVIDNIDANDLNDKTHQISNFVAEGNGLFVIGGGNSFDSGNYKGSRFEQILPAYVAKAGKKRGETNIVFVIDISGSTGHKFGESVKVDVEKALAVDMIQNLSLINNVGAVAFNTLSYKLSDIQPLILNKNKMLDIISRLKYDGGTSIGQGLGAALEMLQDKGGSKDIILISDGKNQDFDEARNAATVAGSKGIRIYSVGVGEDTYKENMQWFADITGGTYFEPDSTDRIRVLFGNTQSVGNKKIFPLVVIDKHHFITNEFNPKASLYGYNQIVPSSSGKVLITTDIGDPILITGRLGLGRIVVLATDYKLYGFELLNKDNSLLTTRTMNWIIGDPERKNEKYINIPDTREDEDAQITIRSEEQPVSDNIALYKIDNKLYMGSIRIEKRGFNSALGAIFAVNYKREYQNIIINPELEEIVKSTNGRMFEDNQVDEIVEYVKQRSNREELKKVNYAWIFAMIALIIYLTEVCIRRIAKNKNL